MTLPEIELQIENIKSNSLLYDEKNFDARADAIDFLEFHILDQVDSLRSTKPDQDKLAKLHQQAEEVKSQLEEIDSKLFQRLQQEINHGKYRGKEFEALVRAYVNFESNSDKEGYDNLDIFINRLLSLQYMPERCMPLEPEMVFYQLIREAGFTKDDVFFDIGSGLGQVAMLVDLLADIKVVGVEFDLGFCKYSGECAAMLGLQNVTFINTDAREADYSLGTVFFMYTPFRGKMLENVLEVLRKESLKRKIRVITYGPCTTDVASQDWLHGTSGNKLKTECLAQFISAW